MSKGTKGSWGYLGKMVGLNIVIIVSIVLLLVVGVTSWLGSYTRHGDHIVVPTLHGVSLDEATASLEQSGLKAVVIDSVYTTGRPGSIVEQMPAAGLPVKPGRIVYLTINAYGVRKVRMQDVREGGSRQALSTLRSLGFIIDEVRKVPSEMNDLVISVTEGDREMEPGREYPVGTRVIVHVGSSNMEMEPENEEIEESWME